MSNKVARIKKNVEERQRYETFLMENTTAGSALLTIAKLAGVKEGSCFAVFQEAEKKAFKNIRELVDYYISVMPIKDNYKENIVLVYDADDKMTPIVTVCISGSEGNVLYLPVGQNGYCPTILRHLNDENVIVEYIFKDEEQGD